MNYIFNFFNPITSSLLDYCDDLSPATLGNYIKKYTHNQEPSLLQKSIALIGVPPTDYIFENSENALFQIRQSIYRLNIGNWQTPIIDLGNLMVDEEDNNRGIILRDVLVELIKNQIVPIVIGGEQELTYHFYRAYDHLEKQVNLSVVDPQFDLGEIEMPLNSYSFLSKIIMDQPSNLLNYFNLGYQTFLNTQEEIELLEKMHFEAYRLGTLKEDITLVEPILRQTDILSIDLKSVKASEIPSATNRLLNGLTAHELCQISRYAGMSDYLSVMALFDEDCLLNFNAYLGDLIAQLIWYFVEGYHLRIGEFPNLELQDFKKYNVLVDDQNITFYKSVVSNRWWLEISTINDKNITRQTLVPCTYKDYLVTTQQEIPERWYINRKKMK